MDILKIATDWAKAEIFSATFFVFFWFMFILASSGFALLGKTELAKAYLWPTIVAGSLLLFIGVWLIIGNQYRVKSFETAYNKDSKAFIESEVKRVEGTIDQYKVVFKVVPLIIVVCALLIIFMNEPIWRASLITTIAMMTVILIVDGNAGARISDYGEQLKLETLQK